MNLWNQFLWVIFPYLALVTFVLGHVYRYVYDQYGWTPKSSQILERRLLMWGVLLFHWGLLFIFIGHVMGLLVPVQFYNAIGFERGYYEVLSLWAGTVAGLVGIAGILLLNIRRWFVSRIKSNTETMKFVIDALLLVVMSLGLVGTLGYRVWVGDLGLPGAAILGDPEFDYRTTLGPWFRGLFVFSPDPALMAGVPLIFQVHTLAAFALFALWPFSSLVHTFSVPIGYLRRSYIQYRSSNPQASMARERARKAGKVPPKAEQSRRVE